MPPDSSAARRVDPSTRLRVDEILGALDVFEYTLPWDTVRRAHGFHLSRRFGTGSGESRVVPEYISPWSPLEESVSEMLGEPYVRLRREKKQISVFLAVDLSRSLAFGSTAKKIELAALFAALMAHNAKAARDRFSFIGFTDVTEEKLYLPPAIPGGATPYQVAEAILDFRSAHGGAAGIRHLFDYLPAHEPSLVFIVSDFLPKEDFLPAVGEAAAVHDCVPIVIRDAREENLPERGGFLSFADAETPSQAMIWLSRARARRFRERVARENALLRNSLRQIGVEPVWFTLDRDEAARGMPQAFRSLVAAAAAYFAERV